MLALCVDLSIGALWDVFDFTMDQLFGLNMQKSGLVDTMKDLSVDTVGAASGAFAGYLYLKGRQLGGICGVMVEFVEANEWLYVKLRNR